MKCRSCKRSIEDDSIFCRFCGKAQAKKKDDITVPKPHRRSSDGLWTAQMMINGNRFYVDPQPSEAKYYAAARALKAHILENEKHPLRITLGAAIDEYISSNSEIFSASTIRGYEAHRRARFPAYMDKQICDIDWQKMLNDEAVRKAPKTVRNGWGLVTAALRSRGYVFPRINLPKVADPDEPWFDYKQIPVFLDAIAGQPCEFQALCALHSLRASEISALQPGSITENGIKVRGAVVMDSNNKLVRKSTNKTYRSARTVPIMIPRILEILPEGKEWTPVHPNTLASQIKAVCRAAGLPELACQGLRRTFCSLAYYLDWDEMTTMQIGGWTNIQTVHKHYAKLSEGKKNVSVKKMERFYRKLNYSRIPRTE